MAAPVDYRTTDHPIAWPVLGIVVYSAIFVAPGLYFATTGGGIEVLVIGIALCGGTAIWSLRFWVYAVHLDDTYLTWTTPLRSGRIRLADVRRVYPSRGTRRYKLALPGIRTERRGANAVIETADRSVIVAVARGFGELLDGLRTRCPGIEISSTPRWRRVAARERPADSGGSTD